MGGSLICLQNKGILRYCIITVRGIYNCMSEIQQSIKDQRSGVDFENNNNQMRNAFAPNTKLHICLSLKLYLALLLCVKKI